MNVNARWTVAWLGLLAGCALVAGERRLCEGTEPMPSPDGRAVLFRLERNGRVRAGVFMNGETSWIDDRPGHSFDATWTPDGRIVYTYGNDVETAFAAHHAKSTSGFNIWVVEKGTRRPLTFGRWRDYAASVSPDGRTVFYTTTRDASAYAQEDVFENSATIYAVPLAGGATTRALALGGASRGAVGPRTSPDGVFMVWAHVDGFYGTWRIAAARTDDLARFCFLTPRTMSCSAPSWSLDGRFLAFTGFKPGDAGWGVWLMHVESGAMRRICDGRRPAFGASGRTILFDRDGAIWERDLTAEDWPVASHAVMADDESLDTALFMRATVRFRPANGLSYVAVAPTVDAPLALQLFFREGGFPEFATRRFDGTYAGVRAAAALKDGETVTLTGVRHGDRLMLFVGNAPPVCDDFSGSGLMMSVLPNAADVRKGANFPGEIHSFEIGRGWPKGLPCVTPPTRRELFGRAGR